MATTKTLLKETQAKETQAKETGLSSSATGHKVVSLTTGEYQEIDGQNNLVGIPYSEAMFDFAKQAGFLVETDRLVKAVSIKEKITYKYQLTFSYSASVELDSPLSESQLTELSNCSTLSMAETIIGQGLTTGPITCSVKQAGKAGKTKAGQEGSKSLTDIDKIKIGRSNLMTAFNLEPTLLAKLKKGCSFSEMKAIREKHGNTNCFRSFTSYLGYANLSENGPDFTKNTSTGIYQINNQSFDPVNL